MQADRLRGTILLVALTSALIGCEASGAAGETTAPSPSPTIIAVSGTVEVRLGEDVTRGRCIDLVASNDPVSVSFADPAGILLASELVPVVVGDVAIGGDRGGCSGRGEYRIDLPTQAVYHIEVNDVSLGPVRSEDLEASDYELDLSAPYVGP